MGTDTAARVYRHLLWLYPRDFRERYGDDLVLTLADLVAELGPRRAWRRLTLDLVVTVPRYRMETLMKEEHQSAVLTATIAGSAVLGIVSVLVGLYVGLLLLPFAAILAITQRSKLARSLEVGGSS